MCAVSDRGDYPDITHGDQDRGARGADRPRLAIGRNAEAIRQFRGEFLAAGGFTLALSL